MQCPQGLTMLLFPRPGELSLACEHQGQAAGLDSKSLILLSRTILTSGEDREISH